MNARREVSESLRYIQRTAAALEEMSHPAPRRALHLLQLHVDVLKQHADEFPEGGWA